MTSSAGTASEVTIDVLNEEIDIEDVGNYTFTQYENYVISPTENDLKNLMVAVTVHHASDPNTSALYTDNGGGDEYDPIPTVFWGWKTGVSYSNCGEDISFRKDCYKVLFISVDCDKIPVVTQPACRCSGDC